MTNRSRLQSFLTRTLDRRAALAKRYRPVLFIIAAVAFVVGTVLAWRALPDDVGLIEWWPLIILALVGVPATIYLNAAEYQQIARMVSLRVTTIEALRIAVLATAANLTPVPGALLVRWGDLSRRGSSWGKALQANLVAGVLWLTLSALALMSVSWSDRGAVFWAGVLFAAGGGLIVALLARSTPMSRQVFLRLAAIEAAFIAVTGCRAFLVLYAFSLPGGVTISIAIASAYSLSSLVGVFPGGLGVREVLSGLVSQPATGGLSTGFLVSAVDRLIGLLIHIPLAGWLSAQSKGVRARSAPEPADG